ncbi:MAG: hypothetical protein WBY93_07110 [Candidatus Binatus sp.]
MQENARGRAIAAIAANPELAGENPDVAVAMLQAELDDLFFDRGRAGFCVGQHQLFGDGVIDTVGFDINVVVVTDDKCHLVKSTSNEPTYKIFSPD